MTARLAFQAGAALLLVLLGVLYLALRRSSWTGRSTLRQLVLWYPLSAPWLLVRTPLLYLFADVWGAPLWAAIVLEFIIERPLFFLTAREIATRVK
jgi:hypothetical protein